MQRSKRQKASEMLAHQHRVEPDHGDRRGLERADRDERGVSDVEPRGQATGKDAREAVDRQQVDDEGVPAPGRYHVEIGQRQRSGPAEGASLLFVLFWWWWLWDSEKEKSETSFGTRVILSRDLCSLSLFFSHLFSLLLFSLYSTLL